MPAFKIHVCTAYPLRKQYSFLQFRGELWQIIKIWMVSCNWHSIQISFLRSLWKWLANHLADVVNRKTSLSLVFKLPLSKKKMAYKFHHLMYHLHFWFDLSVFKFQLSCHQHRVYFSWGLADMLRLCNWSGDVIGSRVLSGWLVFHFSPLQPKPFPTPGLSSAQWRHLVTGSEEMIQH